MAFELKTEVGAHDIDTNCLATPTAIVKYMMEAVDRNMLICTPTYQELFSQGLSFVVGRSTIEVVRPIKEYESIVVSTWATPSKSVSFPRSYLIKVGDEVVAKGLSVWALLDLKEEKLVRGSEFSVEGYGTGDEIELSIPTRFKMPEDDSLTLCGEKKILYSDIDRNFHLNNTKYFDMLFDYIPNRENIYMSSCSMNYVSEAPLGALLNIYISEPEFAEDETFYYFKTEIDGKINIKAKVGVRNI